jgi:hypothetical protein
MASFGAMRYPRDLLHRLKHFIERRAHEFIHWKNSFMVAAGISGRTGVAQVSGK